MTVCNWNVPHGPWERIHMDFFGPINNQMYLIVIDAYSKFIEVVPMRSITAVSVIYQLRQIFARYGLPHSAVTDNGPTWTSHEFASFLKLNGVNHCLTAPFHPATNGAVERAVQTVKKSVKIALKQGNDVNLAILRFLFDYRNSTHCSTCKSPAELMFGRKLRTRFDLLRPDRFVQTNSSGFSENVKGRNILFVENQVVLVKDYRTSQSSNWVKAKIVKCLSPVSYLVKLCNSDVVWKRHSNQMLPLKNQVSNDVVTSRSKESVRPEALFPSEDVSRPVHRRSLMLSPSSPKPNNPVCASPKSPVSNRAVSPNQSATSAVHDPISSDSSPISSTPKRRYPMRTRVPKKVFDL
ncbi:uncharacterized protein K02A2.6-like [Macrosteles quadrilineatus]|uniref:uncharacterized protein K02A2.6-like n=1 Tax=Macrosteles quadrilineatus TaxID=74068 RepID=UPI0023E2B6C6|nr:uncharacterized protein K02A2.6-like [Macrosteles quadrilineatus]